MRALRKHKNIQIFHRYVKCVPRSGTEKELFDLYGLSADKIYQKVMKILKKI
jgi:transketolase C-terminal domain/subunit